MLCALQLCFKKRTYANGYVGHDPIDESQEAESYCPEEFERLTNMRLRPGESQRVTLEFKKA